ncbi:trehalose-phosphatase [Nonomuraea glycinis]|uniref:Trehalose 6-phosphate phosphatase n=1 Tax=Nonomuraea glycinis TaxID=2047744 RepID=A0A918E9A6_9ACTN|nr:trehalose-phosphatase [Nonomuraea glycinis]MCA2182674.1 trehalose-phosphatase [Nonomuraea glycinis]WSG69485.1 trehalose-phosphatase [Nonomuraea glycinis]GGP16746.1 trehalose 6-phosphate phosphatase [Nonomuraea glycinis]
MEAILKDPSGAVIGLDFDGTLSPIVADPAAARVHPDAPAVLAELGAYVNAVAIVTGRPVATALELGPGLERVPGLVVLGHYGFERWENGRISGPPPPAGVPRVEAELPLLLDSLGLLGVTIEDKGRAVAVHTRRSADPEGALAKLREPMAELAAKHGLVVEPGRLVLELRPPGMDKGHALSLFLAERDARSVLFAGDDLGDLAAFDAVRASELPGVTVCSGSAEVTALADRADIVVDGPDGVVALLRELTSAFSRS